VLKLKKNNSGAKSLKFYKLAEVWKYAETLSPFVREKAISIPVANTAR
jgi:hypothetical protein